ncbi:hypothetical protein [Phaeobacter gallaeciensis]|uniref:Uncharacterized protein n=1 Tax=Phaeobacter gallaeciensis TaxID=60890 RepID=A0ABD4XF40_9RHOB|nr:hypothetical protein [Phaeobacter gallaeciensis]MDE4142937.1 hypothetical protein [Phaeobacter gallaeciensis]MDE4147086.1 hypothetical protein [Phaeobacter gallaeciensis]MDE4151384.1 hypothetical protein [Phaeobacter gallaeciensis]MDE4155613.1 hypothetical protein [Phaeobacter gallaeciensis]MDE4159706.1 hypothetical protein [Phaeobacter gallaeciensis]
MARRNSYQSILGDSWHDGSGSVRYSFLDADMPGYHRAVDTDRDGIQDAWRVGGGRVSFDNDFSMNASEQAMAQKVVDDFFAELTCAASRPHAHGGRCAAGICLAA